MKRSYLIGLIVVVVLLLFNPSARSFHEHVGHKYGQRNGWYGVFSIYENKGYKRFRNRINPPYYNSGIIYDGNHPQGRYLGILNNFFYLGK